MKSMDIYEMKWEKDKYNMECPSCENKENNLYRFDYLLSKPRPEYKCKECGQMWHYSKERYVTKT